MKKRVLIIDDNLEVCKEIKYSLINETTDVYYALSVDDGIARLAKQHFCLVIMDIFLSEADGMEVLRLIRQLKPIPILVLSSKKGNSEKIAALQAGAHVFIEKPYKLEECLAYAQSLMELYMQLHTVEHRCYTLAFGKDLIIDPVRHEVILNGEAMNLTRKEFDLLFCLASHAGQVLSREQLYSLVWNNENAYDIDEAVKSQIKTLRKKLTTFKREYIKNVWGIGYRFVDESKK